VPQVYEPFQGSTAARPQSSKSATLRVASLAPRTWAMAAICASAWLIGLPRARRRGPAPWRGPISMTCLRNEPRQEDEAELDPTATAGAAGQRRSGEGNRAIRPRRRRPAPRALRPEKPAGRRHLELLAQEKLAKQQGVPGWTTIRGNRWC
jgi:hypothetical protein